MKTHAIYLEDSYKKEMNATVLDVMPEGGIRYRVILDETVFYPMGGGQPTDQGALTSDGWTGKVYQALMKEGEIWHYIESPTAPTAGMKVHGVIDWDRRYRHMKIHSGGHVVDFAMFLLGYSPKTLMPMKGDHGKKPFIVYQGTLGRDIKQELEAKANELIVKKIAFVTAFMPLEELQKEAIYLQPGLPSNKPLRKLTLTGIGSVADGGTQVADTSEVGHITVPLITEENGTTVVTYRVE
ncbi:MAG TPA: alanyl-tRNA editing protein [Patescibacteria group bacterium]|nr:alanyl-tRNA editing protein [Patescibacteria group bacterium]